MTKLFRWNYLDIIWNERNIIMRYFNTSGPCDPDKHYTVMRKALIAEGQKMVEHGRYFTIFAPRQAGKTTYFQLLMKELQKKEYTPIWMSFEPDLPILLF